MTSPGGTTEKVTGDFGASSFSWSVPSGFASGIPFTQEYSYTTLAISKALQYDILNPPLALSVAKMVQYVIFNSSPASNFFFAA